MSAIERQRDSRAATLRWQKISGVERARAVASGTIIKCVGCATVFETTVRNHRRCKSCNAAHSRKWYQANTERARQFARDYRAKMRGKAADSGGFDLAQALGYAVKVL
jgi:hypothetical protein